MKSAVCLLSVVVATAAVAWQPDFRDIAAQAGLTHVFPNGGPTPERPTKRYIIETTGSGAGWVDYDGDGDVDAILLSGDAGASRLYRNDAKAKFTDVSSAMGFQTDAWAQGICAGDSDNDGDTDIVVTHWGVSILFLNQYPRPFRKIPLPTGPNRYNTGCAFLDYDRDGDLDLFIANYLKFDLSSALEPGSNPYCFYREMAVNCGPRGLPFDTNILLRNEGDNRFQDVSSETGIAQPAQNYSLGVVTGDFNSDGWPDIYVACDQTPSLLYINQRNGTYAEEGFLRGAALDEHGKALSGMGATSADADGDGWPDIFRTNFSDEYETLYRNRGNGDFEDATAAAGLNVNTHYVGWGTGFFDLDNDGWQDLLLVNGHVFPEADKLPGPVRFRQRPILYRNIGFGKFRDISRASGPALQARRVSRGAAFADFDGNGAIEILVNNQNEEPSLLSLSIPPPGGWITIHLQGSKSNRSAIGARVELTSGGRAQTAEVRGGGSYLSQNDLRLHFGLGSRSRVERLKIHWPSGATQTLNNLAANRRHLIVEKPDEPSGGRRR